MFISISAHNDAIATITPIARLIPVKDMILEEVPKAFGKIKLTTCVITICMMILIALRQWNRENGHYNRYRDNILDERMFNGINRFLDELSTVIYNIIFYFLWTASRMVSMLYVFFGTSARQSF